MAGIYIHIPFCKQACYYCNFHFSTSLKLKEDFLQALLKEITFQSPFRDAFYEPAGYLGRDKIRTLYFGGGTPSLLSVTELRMIMDKICSSFTVEEGAEITVEVNPDDLPAGKLTGFREAGVNRLSIGVQSFFDEDLRWMNRAHSAEQAMQCVRLARESGLENISADLIYGVPGLTDDKWKSNVERAVELEIPHLSCYALTVEPGTALEKFIRDKTSPPVDPDKAARQFELLSGWLEGAGYEHYEISNFARPGRRSQHNTSYWKGEPYLGLGPSAHSFNGYSRQWNISNNALYIQSIERGIIPFEIEVLTPSQQLNEYIMISLRTMEGCDLDRVKEKWGEVESRGLREKSEAFILNGYMKTGGQRLILTPSGMLLADGIAAELFV